MPQVQGCRIDDRRRRVHVGHGRGDGLPLGPLGPDQARRFPLPGGGTDRRRPRPGGRRLVLQGRRVHTEGRTYAPLHRTSEFEIAARSIEPFVELRIEHRERQRGGGTSDGTEAGSSIPAEPDATDADRRRGGATALLRRQGRVGRGGRLRRPSGRRGGRPRRGGEQGLLLELWIRQPSIVVQAGCGRSASPDASASAPSSIRSRSSGAVQQ
mmetsp:Transcript_1932/g.5102  ORF Transcript_1932/g.5102 Transcript_1932/m.5102 type:complete len:212 (+) Transcript_1932:744-1379(+)